MLYIRDDDQHSAPFGEPPVVCNYFYHEEVRKSAKKKQEEYVIDKVDGDHYVVDISDKAI
jgi:hypothetical protein